MIRNIWINVYSAIVFVKNTHYIYLIKANFCVNCKQKNELYKSILIRIKMERRRDEKSEL